MGSGRGFQSYIVYKMLSAEDAAPMGHKKNKRFFFSWQVGMAPAGRRRKGPSLCGITCRAAEDGTWQLSLTSPIAACAGFTAVMVSSERARLSPCDVPAC